MIHCRYHTRKLGLWNHRDIVFASRHWTGVRSKFAVKAMPLENIYTQLPHSTLIINMAGEPGSSGSIVSATDGTTGWSRFDPRQRQRIFPLTSVSRSVLGPTQPPVQWIPGVHYPGLKRGRGVTLTTHPHLVPRTRMSKSYTSSPPAPSWRVVGQL
jgi:hypothetical protein